MAASGSCITRILLHRWRRESRRQGRERLRWTVRVRGAVIALFLTLAGGAFLVGAFAAIGPALAASGAGLAMNWVAARRVARWEGIPAMLLWTGVGDAVLITYVVITTGGTASPFLFLYVLQVLTTALVVDVVLGAVVGAVGLVLLTVVAVAGRPFAGGLAFETRPLWLVSLGLTLLVLVFLGGYLTRRLAHSERKLAATHRRLACSLQRLTATHGALQDAYARLARAEAELIETDRMKTLQLLVAGLAHELGNPLTVLVGNVEPLTEAITIFDAALTASETLATGTLTDAGLERARAALAAAAEPRREAPLLLANCAEATRRAIGLLGQLREFGRGGRGTVRRLTSVESGLAGTLALVRYRLPAGVTVHESYADVSAVSCVAAELNQVFINLLMNAIDALAPGGHLWLTLDEDDGAVRVRVRDDGTGIAADVLPHIFDPFVTTKEAGRGTGLGLAISRTIVARHGGSLTVETAPGAGATFTVRLPVPTAQGTVGGNVFE